MKIAIVVGMFPKISETFIVSQITGLIDRGHEVTIIASERAEEARQADVIEYKLVDHTIYPQPVEPNAFKRALRFGVDWFKLAISRPSLALKSLKLAAPLNSESLQRFHLAQLFIGRNFDVVHCHFGFTGKLIAEIKELGFLDCPVVTSYHGVDIGSGVTQEMYRELHQTGEKFTANSKFSADRAVELGCPAELISLLPVGLSLPAFPYTERTLTPSQPLQILTVARLVQSKGIHVAIEAIRQLEDKGIEIHYHIVGDGPERKSLEKQAADLPITFHGTLLREATVAQFNSAHLFVLPSLGMSGQSVGMEGQGLVLQEAQAVGLPVIASRCCGIPEGILEGESGLLVPEGDSTALAEAILRLREQHQEWPEYGRSGRALVEQKFDIENLNDRLVKIYEEVALRS